MSTGQVFFIFAALQLFFKFSCIYSDATLQFVKHFHKWNPMPSCAKAALFKTWYRCLPLDEVFPELPAEDSRE